jgi:hypothetical protein
MKKILFFVLCLLGSGSYAQSIFNCRDGEVSFYSETPLENIDATSKGLNVVLNSVNGEIVLIVPYTSFKFKKALMQEHFNEKYMESDKFPNATFKGKLNETFSITKDTTMEISANGVFNCHGVDKKQNYTATMTIREGKINIKGAFKVSLKDHNIEVPKVVLQNIAEIIDVKFDATLIPYKK